MLRPQPHTESGSCTDQVNCWTCFLETVEARVWFDQAPDFAKDGWYKKDVPKLLAAIRDLENKNTQLKNKLEKGPCGKCRKL